MTETKMYVSIEELWFHFFIHNDDNLKQNKNSYLNENEIVKDSLTCTFSYVLLHIDQKRRARPRHGQFQHRVCKKICVENGKYYHIL